MAKSNRLYFIDAVRAFAILLMLQGHFIDTLLAPAYINNSNSVYNTWSYFRGITAPTFFTISGLVFAYLLLHAHAKGNDKPRIRKGLFRGLLLIIIGYSLRINILDWLYGAFNSDFLIVDVLQCIGVSLILLVCLHYLFKRNSYIYSIVLFSIGFICFLSEPLYRHITLDNIPEFIANYLTTANGSVFTILPWLGYSAFGAFIATIFYRHVNRPYFKPITVISFYGIGGFLIYFSSAFLTKLNNFTHIDLLKMSADYNYLFPRLGNVLVLFGTFYALEQFLKQSIIVRIGEKTLSIYVVHFILLYGSYTNLGLKRFLNKSLEPTTAIFGAILFIVVACFISFHYAKTNTFLYNLIRKTTRRLKSYYRGLR